MTVWTLPSSVFDVTQGQQRKSGNRPRSTKSPHQRVKAVMVKVGAKHVQTLVLFLAGIVGQIAIAVIPLVFSDHDVEQMEHGGFYSQ